MMKKRIIPKKITVSFAVVLLVMISMISSVCVSGEEPFTVTIKNPIVDSIVFENDTLTVQAEVSNYTNVSKVVFYEFSKPGYQSKVIGEDTTYPYEIQYTPTYYYNMNGYSSNHILAKVVTTDNQNILSEYRRFYVFLTTTQKPESNIAIATWKDNKQSAYTPTYDDNYLIESQKVINTLHKQNIVTNQSRNIKGTLFWDTNQANWYELNRAILSESYLGMGAHTMSHCDGFQVSLQQMNNELQGARNSIIQNTNQLSLTHAYPYYKVNDSIINLTKQYYIAARWGSDNGNRLDGSKVDANDPAVGINAYNTTDYYKIKAMCPDTSTPASTFNNWLNDAIAQKGWLVTSMHGVNSKHPYSWKCQNEAQLNEHYDYVQTKINDGSVWNDTFENVALYLRERNAAVLTDRSNANQFQYKYDVSINDEKLSDNLQQYLTHPLTITVKLPQGWLGVRVQQGTNTIASSLTAINGEVYAMFDVMPGQGEFTISRAND